MKYFLRIAALLALFAFPATEANAIACGTGAGTCFGIATGNWNAGATWSDTSGGASCSATCTTGPVAGDAVTLDSGTNTKNVTINATSSIATLVSTCTTCTLTHNSSVTLTVTGNTFTLSSGMTYTPLSGASSLIKFASTTGTTAITTATKVLSNVTFDGVGGTFQLQDDLTATLSVAVVVTLTNGTFDANGKNVRTYAFNTSNANTRTVTCGSGTWTIGGGNSTVTVWDASTSTNLTFSCGSATIQTVAQATFEQRFSFKQNSGTPTVGTINFAANQNGSYSITLAVTFTNVIGTAPFNLRLIASSTVSVTNAFALTGTSSNPILIESTTSGTQAAFSVGAASTAAWTGFKDLVLSTSALTATNSMNYGNITLNTSTITPPSAGGGGRIIGG